MVDYTVSKFRERRALVGGMFLLGLSMPVAALAGRQKGLTRDESIQVFDQNENYALIIGVNEYHDIGHLNYAVKDAEKLAKLLEDQGYVVELVTDYKASKRYVLKQLGILASLAGNENQPSGSFVFAFSGHGFQENGRNYLATSELDPENIADTGVAVDDVVSLLKQSNVRQRVMFIDACRNDPNAHSKGYIPDNQRFLSDDGSEGLAILYSTKEGSLSWEDPTIEQGVFSHYLIKGLEGEAAAKDGLITFEELRHFVTHKVKRHVYKEFNKAQVPYVAGERTGLFVLAKSSASTLTPNTTPLIEAPKVEQPAPVVAPEMASLTVRTYPSSATVRIMNIIPTYRAGMRLEKNRSYDILVTADGYKTQRQDVVLVKHKQIVDVRLELLPKVSESTTSTAPIVRPVRSEPLRPTGRDKQIQRSKTKEETTKRKKEERKLNTNIGF